MRATHLLALALVAAGGCTGGGSAPEDEAAAPAIETIEAGVLTACVAPTPAAVVEEGGSLTGFDVEVLAGVAEGLGLDLELVEVTFDELVSGVALNAMTCDVGAGAVVDAAALDAVVRTSVPYRTVHHLVLAPGPADAPDVERDLEDVSGRVGVEESGRAAAAADALAGATVVELPSTADLDRALAEGTLDAILVTREGRADLAGGGDDLALLARVPTEDETVLLLPMAAEDATVEAVDAQLQRLVEEGTIAELTEEWLGA